jgi:hypothetical protein
MIPDRHLELARETASLIPNSEVAQNVLARVLLNSGDSKNHDEAIALLVARLHAFPGNYAHFTLLARALASDFSIVDDPVEFYRKIVGRLPNDPELIGKIQWVMARQPSGITSAEAFLRASLALGRFKDNALLRNLFAKALLLAVPAKREEAIRVLRETRRFHPEDTYSSNQLAGALAASGIPEEAKEAIAILEATVQNELTDNPFSRELLAKLTGKAEDVSAAQPEEPTDEEPTDIGQETENEEAAESAYQVEGVESHQSAPPELSRLAQAFRLKFRLAHTRGEMKDAAINELHSILKTDPTFAYAQLLAVRLGLWEKENQTLPSFPAAFELALMKEDVEALSRLAKAYPRLEALTMIARAMFGDKSAAKQVQASVEKAVEAKSGIEKMLNETVGPILRLIEGGKMSATSLRKSREQVIAKLRDVNEWAIGGGDWRIAA